MGHVFHFSEAVNYEQWFNKPQNKLAFVEPTSTSWLSLSLGTRCASQELTQPFSPYTTWELCQPIGRSLRGTRRFGPPIDRPHLSHDGQPPTHDWSTLPATWPCLMKTGLSTSSAGRRGSARYCWSPPRFLPQPASQSLG